MQRFNGREAEQRSLEERFGDLPGYRAWQALIRRLQESTTPDAFDAFLGEVEGEVRGRQSSPMVCCLFISHRLGDEKSALHIASIANAEGYDYWLDIHDATLAKLNASKLPPPAKDILIAAAIEIGLLNSTHVIALHTKRSTGSKWIPYELGRAKARMVYSNQAAGWFSRHVTVAACGEYVHLAVKTFTSPQIHDWLRRNRQCKATQSAEKRQDDPPPLDKDDEDD